jgi:hypothetical protein
MPPVNFTAAADELRRQEIARLADVVVPRLEALRAMTPAAFRTVIAGMLERFGHQLVTDPAASSDLVTTKEGRKFVTVCAQPADLAPTGMRDLIRPHHTVTAANAQRGFFITAHSFTREAEQYAESGAPIELIDGARLVKILNRSRKGELLPQTYKAMCGQCGDIVQHRLGDDQVRPCANGHADATKPAPRPLSRREIRAHNAKYEARMMRKPRASP